MSTIEGGMICTNDPDIYQYLRMIRSHGMLRESSDTEYKANMVATHPDLNELFIFTHPGFNVRNNEIGAIIGISQLKRLDSMIAKRAKNFEHFLANLPSWAYQDFDLAGQSNYAFNLILKDKDPHLMNKVESVFNKEGIEYRRGSAGGGNQLRQPYVQKILNTHVDPSAHAPVADHVHFYGMYLGNYPDLEETELNYLLDVINSIQ